MFRGLIFSRTQCTVISDKSQDSVATHLWCGGYTLLQSVLFAGERNFKIITYLEKLQANGRLFHMPCLMCTVLLKGADFAR